MKKIVLFLFASLLLVTSKSQTVICYWDVSTQSNFGTSPLPVTGNSPCISNTGLVRGSGVSLIGTGASRGWGGTGFDHPTAAEGITANAFITTQLTVRDGYAVSLSQISPFDYRTSFTGPTNALVQYKLNSGSFIDVTTLSFPSTSPVGASAGAVNLSSIAALQNLPFGSVVTFRIVPYGATANSGDWYIFDRNNFTGPDLAITGVVTNLLKYFYSKPAGDLSQTSSWGTNTDGTGIEPADFTTDNRIFKLVNRTTSIVNINWTFGGNNSILHIGDSVTGTELIPSTGITITIGAGASLIINPLSVISVPLGGTVNFSGNPVTLASTAVGTGRIGTVKGALLGATNITSERFIPSNTRKSYTMVSSPVNAPSMFDMWQEGGVNSNGYGTVITGATGTLNNGFDAESASGLASVFTYDDNMATGSKWRSVLSTVNTKLGAGKGFLIYVRGNRTIAPTSTAPVNGNANLRATGAITVGDTTLSGLTPGSGKFTLIANPYPSAINWVSKSDGANRDIVLNNVSDIFYVYDPSLGTFASYNGATNTLSPSTSKQPSQFIHSGQAFFVMATGSSPSIAFKEAAKTGSVNAVSNSVFNETAARPRLNVNVYKAADNSFADGAVAVFDNAYKAGIDREDAVKFTNFAENVAFERNGEKLSIEGRPLVNGNDTIRVALSNFSKAEYSLTIGAFDFANTAAVLEDRYTGIKQQVSLEGNTTYKFTVNNDAASYTNRFFITFGSTIKTAASVDINQDNKLFVKLTPNPVRNQVMVSFKTSAVENVIINIVNSLGQVIRTVNPGKLAGGNITISAADFAPGVYSVQLISGDKIIANQKLIKE